MSAPKDDARASGPVAEPESEQEDRTVCFCHNVPLSRILEVIRAGGTSIEAIQSETCASTGCGGCEWDVREILEAELAKTK
jgi:nitrite reductase (NADH) large subunit